MIVHFIGQENKTINVKQWVFSSSESIIMEKTVLEKKLEQTDNAAALSYTHLLLQPQAAAAHNLNLSSRFPCSCSAAWAEKMKLK